VVSQPIVQDPDLKVGGIDDSGVVKEDGTFFVAGIFGRTRIRATLPDGWVLKSVLRDGRDITDDPIAPGSRETISGIQVIVSEQISTITGQVTDDRGMPIDEGTVIVFHRDSEKWEDPNRYVHAVRPDQQGQFTIRGLPPGEYLALAEQYVPAGQWTDPDYLASIRRYGQRVAVSEGAAQAISLKLINP
jgi:hypothetical protein